MMMMMMMMMTDREINVRTCTGTLVQEQLWVLTSVVHEREREKEGKGEGELFFF